MQMKISAVLINYNRPRELEEIKKHLSGYSFIDEIIVRDNAADNLISYGRYVAMREARNPIIYFQDDDCIIGNLQKLYDEFCNYHGQVFVNGMKAERMQFYNGPDSMCGWGAFLYKDWVWVLDLYIQKYGIDYVLMREADRIFTMLMRVPRRTIVADVKDFPSAMSPDALSLQLNHEDYKRIAIERSRKVLDYVKHKDDV
jgi:hypothetical protein